MKHFIPVCSTLTAPCAAAAVARASGSPESRRRGSVALPPYQDGRAPGWGARLLAPGGGTYPAVGLLDQLQPRRLGLRLVAGAPGEVGAEQRVDEVPNPSAFPSSVDGAHGLELAHDLGDLLRPQ